MHTTQISSGIFSRVNDLRMNKSERMLANAYIQDGERLGGLFSLASTRIRSGVVRAGHAVGSLAQGVKAAFAKPARH